MELTVKVAPGGLYLIDSRSLIPICHEHDISARILGLGTSPSTLAVPRVASLGQSSACCGSLTTNPVRVADIP